MADSWPAESVSAKDAMDSECTAIKFAATAK